MLLAQALERAERVLVIVASSQLFARHSVSRITAPHG